MTNKKILIIDDDRALVHLLTLRITEAGYEVLSALDGVQGLRLAFQEKPSLIILDIRFPAGGGIETLKKIKSSHKTMSTPIVIITIYDDPQTRQEVSKYDVKEFMVKPIDPSELVDKIREIIGD